MNKANRLLEIWLYIIERKNFTNRELAEKFNVSSRTIQRDIDELSLLGVPFYSVLGKNGGYQMMNQKLLPPISFTEEEIISLIIIYKQLLQYEDTPFTFEIEGVIKKLLNQSTKSLKTKLEVIEKHLYVEIPKRNEKAPFLKDIFQASLNQNSLKIDYESVNGVNSKTIFPIGIYSSNGFWYFCAFEELSNLIKVYRADRVKMLEINHNSISPELSLPSVKEFVNNHNKFNSINLITVKMKINKKAIRIHNSAILDFDKINWVDSFWGELEFKIPNRDIPFLVSHLTIYGNNIKIISPQYVIKELINHLESIKVIYI